MKLKYLLLAALLLLPLTSASAQQLVDMNFLAGTLQDAQGNAMSTSGLVLVVADTGNNGFSGLDAGATLNINSVIGGTDDRIVTAFDGSLNMDPGVVQNSASANTFNLASVTNWQVGDKLELVWLPGLTLSSLGTSLAAGTDYGVFQGPTGTLGESWTTPALGATVNYEFGTEGSDIISGTEPNIFPSSAGLASDVVEAVPEPNTWALSLLGFGALLFVLRRKRACI